MCGKQRSYEAEFCGCGREGSYGIFADEREVGGTLEGLREENAERDR